ncbi:MAG: hypothetical protein AAB909_01785 [Patescibacteria group bacterium]
MSLPLVEKVSFRDAESTERSLNAVWGLIELRECLIREGTDQSLLMSVNDRLTSFLSQYKAVVGSDHAVTSEISNRGYVDDGSRAWQLMTMSVTDDQSAIDRDVEKDIIPAVGITGLIRAGKGIAGKILSVEYSGIHTPFVESLIAYSYALGYLPDTDRVAKREVNDLIKPRFGNTTFAEASIRRAKRRASGRHIRVLSFDGLRSVDEARLFLDRPMRRLIAIEASLETRYRRARESTDASKYGEKPKTWESFVVDSEFERIHMMGPAIDLAQITFPNEGEEFELTKQLVEYFDPIIGEWK